MTLQRIIIIVGILVVVLCVGIGAAIALNKSKESNTSNKSPLYKDGIYQLMTGIGAVSASNGGCLEWTNSGIGTFYDSVVSNNTTRCTNKETITKVKLVNNKADGTVSFFSTDTTPLILVPISDNDGNVLIGKRPPNFFGNMHFTIEPVTGQANQIRLVYTLAGVNYHVGLGGGTWRLFSPDDEKAAIAKNEPYRFLFKLVAA